MKYEQITERIIGASFEVLNTMGIGFVESVYEISLMKELKSIGLEVERQKKLDVYYKSELVGMFYADLLVERKIIVELKVAKAIHPAHQAQLINYLKATGLEVGLILNFGHAKLDFKRVYFNK